MEAVRCPASARLQLATRDGADYEKRFFSRSYCLGKRSIGRFMREILFAGEEAQKGPPLLCDMVADGAPQHRIARFKRIEYRAYRQRTINVELHFAIDFCQCP